MDTDLKKIKRYTKMMKKEGVLIIKTPELEIQLSPLAVFHEESKSTPDEPGIKEDTQMYSETDALFWSVPGQLPDEATL